MITRIKTTNTISDSLTPPVTQNHFESICIDRLAEQRKDKTWLEEVLKQDRVRIIPVWQDMHLIKMETPDQPVAIFPSYAQWHSLHPHLTPEILLGQDLETDEIYFTVELPELDNRELAEYNTWGEFQNLRNIGLNIHKTHGALMAYAQGMIFWHRNHGFCGRCGSRTQNAEGGHLRICSSEKCLAPHFPRTDPAVIVRITAGDYCLLGRGKNWRIGVYSTIAGFVEPGESLEMTVMRETLEETGVQVEYDSIRYHSSQPWPFPASIMLGFTAEAKKQEIHIDRNELDDARWFSRQDIDTGLAKGDFKLPSPFSIAHRLIDDWRFPK